jgi:2,4-dienoyl-CoA reductase-like NADH-dependent reductase (Old Yellow Enzyme family)/thioredoxin reductase
MNLVNRLVMPSMGTNFGSEDGHVTERLINYYEERANRGPGLIIPEMISMDFPLGRRGAHQLRIDEDKYVEGLQKLTDRIHNTSSKIAIQLCHAGILAGPKNSGLLPVAPSPVDDFKGMRARQLTVDEIEIIITRFIEAAQRAKKANFDGVEVHAAHSYLLAHFLSPAFNRRLDGYGGSIQKRARILLEILERIRKSLGSTFPIWCRLNGMEYGLEGGLTIEESKKIAQMVAEAGSDAIHVSAFGYGSYFGYNRACMGQPRGNLSNLAAEIKKVVKIPVIAVGRIDFTLGERLVRESKADLIAIGRAQIADPHIIRKAAEGRFDDIRPCISCNVCVDDLTGLDMNLHCSINACVGKEREYDIKPAQNKKRVLVIGGGPGGMEAARVAALRGHEVTIYEKQGQLGGKLILASTPPHKDEIRPFAEYLINQIKKLGVNFELGKEADLTSIKNFRPDVLILATGATPLVPRISGINHANIAFAEDVLSGKTVGQKIAIIGGGLVGCETAEFLVQQGKVVTIIEMLNEIAIGIGLSFKIGIINRLAASGVTTLTGVKCEEISETGVVITDKEGKKQTIAADTTVFAVGAKSSDKLLKSTKDMVFEVYTVGDCVEPRRIKDAIADGYRVGLAI